MLAGPERAGTGPVAHDPFERLFVAEYPRVVAIAQRIVRETHAAEDIAQDVFVAFHRGHHPSAPFAAAWLHRATVHSALNHLRARRRRDAREALRHSFEAAERNGASFTDPLAIALRAESRREVRAALGRLPEKGAAVLALRYSGLAYSEIAAALGVNVNQVGTLLVRAESAFKKEITRVASR